MRNDHGVWISLKGYFFFFFSVAKFARRRMKKTIISWYKKYLFVNNFGLDLFQVYNFLD